MSEPVSVALTWLNFPLSVLLALQGAVTSVTNVYYDMDITILKALFLENDGVDYFRYANNRIFQTLDVAKFTTSADIWMQDHALQYVADESSLVLANVSNQSAWLTAFRAAMETKLTALDATAMLKDMGSGPTFTPLDPGITLSRNASTDEVQIGAANFTSLPFVVGDMVYFDVACTFANAITKTYRVNLRARASNVQVYPMKYLPPPQVYAVNMYICKPESVPTTSTWTINTVPYTFPFQVVGGMNSVNILLRHGFYIIFSSDPLTIGNDVPAGVTTLGDAAIFNWLLQESTDVFETVPTITADVLVGNSYLTDYAISEIAQLTTQGKLIFSITPPFTAVDDRIHDSGTAYGLLGFTRQQPYKCQRLAYFQGVRPELPSPVPGYYFIVPSVTAGLMVTLERQSGTTTYDYAAILAGTHAFIGKLDNKVFIISEGIVSIQVSDQSSIKSCVIYPGLYTAVAPLPVTETSYANTYSNSGFLQTVPPLFSDLGPTFQLTAERIQAGIQTFASPYVCRKIPVTENGLTSEFLQIEKLTAFTVGAWPDAGFHEDRVSTQLTADVKVRLTLNSNGGMGDSSQLYNVGNTVSSLDSSPFANQSDIFVKFNTQSDGLGLDFVSFAIVQNTTFYAIWSSENTSTNYNITYVNTDGGTNVSFLSAAYNPGDTATVLPQGNMEYFINDKSSNEPIAQPFRCWKNANQEIFYPGDTFLISSNLVFTACYGSQDFSFIYYASGGVGAPVDDTWYALGETFILPLQGSLVKPDFQFKGWQWGQQQYLPGSTFIIANGGTIIALWAYIPIQYYDQGEPILLDNSLYAMGDTVTVLDKIEGMDYPDHSFQGWQLNGSIYVAGNTFVIPFNEYMGNIILTAVWVPIQYTVTYDKNAAGAVGNQTDAKPYTANQTVTVQANTFSYENRAFNGWNTASDGSGTSYAADDTFPITGNTTLYAQWQLILQGSQTYTVTYTVGNLYTIDSGQPPAAETYSTGTLATMPGPGTMVKADYDFAGWRTNSSSTVYGAGATVNFNNTSATLISTWQLTNGGQPE